jgi:CspA family cold shock protein
MHVGRVTAFDGFVGLGEITDAAGRTWPFHCIEIADGSRTIEVGTDVAFEPLAKFGRFEASRITPR